MKSENHAKKNRLRSMKLIGYVHRQFADKTIYESLGFKCGLEVHQQLKTKSKLFCHCSAGVNHGPDNYNAEILRHMRPTLSELGEYDRTALMEFKTRKNIYYRLNYNTSCTYEIDEAPPFPINRQALDIAIEIALLLKTNIVGEIHITRKQYLDGSIPTGFQRTAIIGIEGRIPLSHQSVGIKQMSIEEESCREVSDIGHDRTFTTDRLGIPLIEAVTYPDLRTPEDAAEAGQYIRFLTRSTNKVRTGIGAARQDVNVSIDGGSRVEIKGVAHIAWIPELTHNEAFRQKSLLEIKKTLLHRIQDPTEWKLYFRELSINQIPKGLPIEKHHNKLNPLKVLAINLPEFKGILSFFTQPGQSFSNELSDRIKVIACLKKPHMIHSEPWEFFKNDQSQSHIVDTNTHTLDLEPIRKLLKSKKNDAQIIIWGEEQDLETALKTIEERCDMAFQGVPEETRKAFANGTTEFERVLPGPNRMYPDTDSAPIPIKNEEIQTIRQRLPRDISEYIKIMKEWQIPIDTYSFILKRNLFPLLERIINDFNLAPIFIGTLIGHQLKHLEGNIIPFSPFDYNRIYSLLEFIIRKKLKRDILYEMLPVIYEHPNMDLNSVLSTINYQPLSADEVVAHIPILVEKFKEISVSKEKNAMIRWVMGTLRPLALGNIELKELYNLVKGFEEEN